MRIRNVSAGMNQQERFPRINAYLIEDTCLIDPGMSYDIRKNANLEEIQSVFLTFPYVEHYGILEEFDFGDITVFIREGEEPDIDADYNIREVSGGDIIKLGGKAFEVIERNGVMDSIGLYNEDDNLLFGGHLFIDNHDMIRSHGTRHSYLRFLRDLRDRKLDMIYPAHGDATEPDFIGEEIKRVEDISPDRALTWNMDTTGNSMIRGFEHEWNRGFENPFRRYMPNEKWMFYIADPEHGKFKQLFGAIAMYIAVVYLLIVVKLNSEKELDRRYGL